MSDPIKPPAARVPGEALELVALAQYEKGALLAGWPGPDQADVPAVLAGVMALRLPVSVRIVSVTVNPELALVLCGRDIAGLGPDGEPVRLGGSGCAVLRPQPDGTWRIAADVWHLESG